MGLAYQTNLMHIPDTYAASFLAKSKAFTKTQPLFTHEGEKQNVYN